MAGAASGSAERNRTQPRLPPLADVRDAVRYELVAARRREANKAFYKTLRDRYAVVVERRQPDPPRIADSVP